MLTFLPLEEIAAMEKWEGADLNRAKEILAYELTSLVHNKDEADKCLETARALFTAGGADQMPTAELCDCDLVEGKADILSVLVKCGLCPSKSEARRAVEQGGVEADGAKITEFSKCFTCDELRGDGVVVKRGKKNFKRVVLK
jgi:tyrosyl-tRNA synthetase